MSGNAQYPQNAPMAGDVGMRQQYLGLPCRVNQPATQTINANAYTKVSMATANVDVGSQFSSASNCIVPPVTGVVMVMGHVRIAPQASGSNMAVAIFRNGALAREGNLMFYSFSNQSLGLTVADLLSVNANDLIDLRVFSSATAFIIPLNTFQDNYLSLFQLA